VPLEPILGDHLEALRPCWVFALDDGLDDSLRLGASLVDADYGIADLLSGLLAARASGNGPEALGTLRRDAYMKTTLVGVHFAITGFLDREIIYVVVGELLPSAVARSIHIGLTSG
jgi:hypothetical protein